MKNLINFKDIFLNQYVVVTEKRQSNGHMMFMQRRIDVASTLMRRCMNIMCPLGSGRVKFSSQIFLLLLAIPRLFHKRSSSSLMQTSSSYAPTFSGNTVSSLNRETFLLQVAQLAFYVNLHRAVIGPSATLTGR